MESASETSQLTLEAVVSRKVMTGRLLAGLLQGLLLYGLYRAANEHLALATLSYLFVPLLMAGVLLPVLLISSLGHLNGRQTAWWMLAALAVVVVLATHEVWRDGSGGNLFWTPQDIQPRVRTPSPQLWFFSVCLFFIAHVLVLSGAVDGRRVASYPTYFETAWRCLIQLKFSALFVGALWLVLWLGAALFMLVKLDFLKQLLEHSWFAVPVSCFAFSCAMHITDVRPAIVRGIRTLLLVLMSWILPIAALIMAGFLCTLPFTGLDTLWHTRYAAKMLLGADVVLVVLINAAFQNGETGAGVARTVRLSARIAAALLLPLTAIAVYALALRVGDHGWSIERIIAAACFVVAACYAIGYAWAAFHNGPWLAAIATVNVATALVTVAVLLALFTPIADPARLSVNDQMARLASGKTSVDKFDFSYLRFEGARYGKAALEQLKSQAQGPNAALISKRAAQALSEKSRWELAPAEAVDLKRNLTVWPAGTQLPDGVLQRDWNRSVRRFALPPCLTQNGVACDAFVIDFTGDGKPEVLLMSTDASLASAAVLGAGADGTWEVIGRLPYDASRCEPLRKRLKAGDYTLVARRGRDLQVAGQRIALDDTDEQLAPMCALIDKAGAPSGPAAK